MKWNVYRYDLGSPKVRIFNVFDHGRFREDVEKLLEEDYENRMDYQTFSEKLQHYARYYFWSKCEYEVVITNWPYHIENGDLKYGSKIDIYDQLNLNWNEFVLYVRNKQCGYKEQFWKDMEKK